MGVFCKYQQLTWLTFRNSFYTEKEEQQKKAASKPPKCKQTQFFCEMGDVQSWSCAGQPIFTSFFQFLTLWGHDFGVVREAEDDFWRPASIALVLKCHRSPTFVLQYLNLSQKIWFHKTTKLPFFLTRNWMLFFIFMYSA